MVTWTAIEVRSNGVRLHVERTGEPRPPLVLLHGFTDDGRCWIPVAEAFADVFEVITIDARGHGRSEAPDRGWLLEDTAGDVATVIGQLGLERPAILGHSLGAVTAMAVAGLHPDVPSAIVLEDPPAVWLRAGPTPADAGHARSAAAGIATLKRLTRADLLREAVTQNPGWPDAEIEPWVESKLAFDPRAVTLATPDHLATIDVRAVLRAITCPVTVLHGEAALGSMPTVADLEVLRGLVPQLAVVHIPGAGHSIRRDQPARYAAAVREALGA